MHLEAERTETNLLQSVLNNAEGCHLLGNEQYALALENGVGYDVGDGLRLSRSRRAVENERATFAGGNYGCHLRRVNRHGQSQTVGTQILVGVLQVRNYFLGLEDELLLNKTAHDVVLEQFLAVAVNIVPQKEFVEREHAQDCFFFDVPTFFVLQGIAYYAENERHINAVLIGWQRRDIWNMCVRVLSQEF